ncbi:MULTISPECIES: YfhO family protein [Bacillus]|uniref:Multidrug transporter n=2 Tax=Bacillus TaxID=1386 RepID=A0A0M4FZ95_9BACI|nr:MULTISPECIES: YfhO family protein [Bacillus]ALC82850.1 hypothetical protein AM592_15575 [Bacillus gobiensis]MBP1081816.1 putative membrane protein YfhO [Bacillus capparidis]MED1096464.1 YfhO family protein [Bacillus capparidis]
MNQTKRSFLLSISVFALFAVFIHFYFLFSSHSYFTGTGDSLHQGGAFLLLLSKMFTSGDFFWSWQYGIGGDLFGEFGYYYTTSIFFWISLIFKQTNLQDVFTIKLWMSVYKSFLSMLFMYLLLIKGNRSQAAAIISPLIYGGSIIFLRHSMLWDFMADAIVWLPLVILGYERLARDRKPLLFVLAAALMISSNFYFAFMSSVFLFLYAIFTYHHRKLILVVRDILYLSGHYLLALGLAAFAFLPAVNSLFHADRSFGSPNVPLFFTSDYYVSALHKTFFIDDPYYVLGLPIATLFLIVLSFSRLSIEGKRITVLALFMYGLYFIPFSFSFFNGLSDMQSRWVYLLVFTVSLAASYSFDTIVKYHQSMNLLLVGLCAAALIGTIQMKPAIMNGTAISGSDRLLLIGTLLVTAVFFSIRYLKTTWVSLLLCLLIAGNILMIDYFYSKTTLAGHYGQNNITSSYFDSQDLENKEAAEAIRQIQANDPGFYRIMSEAGAKNTPMIQDFNGTSAYQSMINKKVHRFFKEDYSILHSSNSVNIFRNFDDRFHLHNALGVKYMIYDKDYSPIPFGAKKIRETENLSIYENPYALPIAYMQYNYVTQQEFDQLATPYRDSLLAKAAVIDEKHTDGLHRYSVKDLPVSKVSVNVSYENIETHGNRLTADKNAAIHIPVNKSDSAEETMVKIKINEVNGNSFEIRAGGKQTIRNSESNIYTFPVKETLFNLGMYDEDEITVRLSPGTYQLDRIEVYRVPPDDQETLELKTKGMENATVTEGKVSGTIESTQKGILTTSIPFSNGWTVHVNGEKIDPIIVNKAFIGVPLEKGSYQIEMTYTTPYFFIGLYISIASLLLLIGYQIMLTRKKRG